MPMQATLALLVRDHSIILGIKKQKLGKGKYNGFGGKLEQGETAEEAFLRELREETNGVVATRYEKVAEMTYTFTTTPEWNQTVHVYLVKEWQGEPRETEEMGVETFPLDNIPYERMWDNDRHWLPLVLEGKKIRGEVLHDHNSTHNKHIQVVEHF